MQRKLLILLSICVFLPAVFFFPLNSQAAVNRINAKSAILIDMETGCVLFEQNSDSAIAPASITKVLSLYIIFESIKEGQIHLWDKVEVSRRAASTGGSRMGLKAGTRVPMEELIKGMAVVSGNDACVAAAEHISGSVERFVVKMNAKARELGMTNSRFMTPNGLPASGQVTTARDIAKLSTAYLRRFPESLSIHSMQAYSYGRNSHHNANRLLGKCPGVDGLKTGFVCASGYNISATAKRGGNRILAVVMGARTPWIRLAETEKLIEAGFRECGSPRPEIKFASGPDSSPEISRAPAPSRAASCRLQRKQVKARLAKINTRNSKKSGKAAIASKQARVKKVAVKTVAAKNGKKKALASAKTKAEKNSKSAKKIARSNAKTAKSAQVKGARNSQNTKAGKSVKSAKASKTAKSSARQASKKTTQNKKNKSQATVLKKKPKG